MDVKQRIALEIDGMSCQKCVSRVKATLADIEGVDVKSVNVGAADVEVDPSLVCESTLIEAVAEAGYEARVSRE